MAPGRWHNGAPQSRGIKMRRQLGVAWVGVLALGGCGAEAPDPPRAAAPAEAAEVRRIDADTIRRATGAIDDARLASAADDLDNWLMVGRTYGAERFSPLDRIHEANVSRLGLAWSLDLETVRGVEATPLAVDGVLFTTGPWSVVYAVDGASGQLIWSFDPEVPRSYAEKACCDVVNRGLALYKGKVYVGTLDGRLVALDAATGEVVWETLTVDSSKPYTITGAPRIVQGKVIIGNGGAEFGVRGYVTAYDAETGRQLWRTYTVPGNPAKPFESAALKAAARTWKGGEWWKVGGGGTVWDSIVYDPELDLLYVGTGNGSPWSRYARSPGGGDNLYLCSILALRPSDGSLVWFFQTTPGDNWDFTSTQPMLLATLEIEGKSRDVLMQAPKNGFFYVLDRKTGEFISGANFAEVTWATGLDENGRPIEAPNLDYDKELQVVKPSPYGAHNWHPMSYSGKTGLVYIPAQEIPSPYLLDPDWEFEPGAWNTALDFSVARDLPVGSEDEVTGSLLAWDPVEQREIWRVPHVTAWNGGTLATAGNLVFQGTADGRFVAYRASDGEKLWESPAGTGVIAGPMSYRAGGDQYVTVSVGWGGAFALAAGAAAAKAGVRGGGRLLGFRIDGTAQLPRQQPRSASPAGLPSTASEQEILAGGALYHRYCYVCHGAQAVSGGVIPDLRHASAEVHASFSDIVLGGIRVSKGMPSFAGRLSSEEVALIQSYLRARAAGATGIDETANAPGD